MVRATGAHALENRLEIWNCIKTGFGKKEAGSRKKEVGCICIGTGASDGIGMVRKSGVGSVLACWRFLQISDTHLL